MLVVAQAFRPENTLKPEGLSYTYKKFRAQVVRGTGGKNQRISFQFSNLNCFREPTAFIVIRMLKTPGPVPVDIDQAIPLVNSQDT